MNVECFGGPYDGKTIAVEGDRFEVVFAELPPAFFSSDDEAAPYPEPRYTSYEVHPFAEGQGCPIRTRRRRIAVVHGAKLPRVEDLCLEKAPWNVWPGHFLHDFEQWFSWAAHKYTGELWWLGKRVLQ